MVTPNSVLAKIERRVATLFNSRPFDCRPERPIVSITFDDFAKSAWEAAGPILAAHDAHASYYACGGLLGTEFDGILLANADDVQAVAAAGHEIGCHTHRHVCLQGPSARTLEEELDRNREAMQALLPQQSLQTFAYPFGATGIVGKRLTARRFAAARGVWRGINQGKIDLMQLQTHSVPEVGKDAATARSMIEQLAATNGWLVLYTHDVAAQPSAGGCTPEQLATVLTAARNGGCELLSVAEALTAVGAPGMVPA
ncbi:MAG: polysaccharide deacetylase family protein [Planctomycetota bacterium]